MDTFVFTDLEMTLLNEIENLQNQPNSRELSLVITKLEEALLWLSKVKIDGKNVI